MKKVHKKVLSRPVRILLKAMAFILSFLGIMTLVLYFYLTYQSRHYEINFYQITSDKVESNVRIVFLSDLHMREYGEGNEKLLTDIAAIDPDLVLIGGDLTIYPDKNYDSMLSFCKSLSKNETVYMVTGNHEDELIYQADDTQLISKFENAGVYFLENADEIITVGGNEIQLVGVTGGLYGYNEYGGKEEMESLEDFDGFRIVMAHVPALFLEELTQYSFDLGLAGHVHGGIVRLPKIGGLYSAEEGFFPTYSKGLYNLSNGASLIVTGGLGDSSKIPFRINSAPEFDVIDINWY